MRPEVSEPRWWWLWWNFFLLRSASCAPRRVRSGDHGRKVWAMAAAAALVDARQVAPRASCGEARSHDGWGIRVGCGSRRFCCEG